MLSYSHHKKKKKQAFNLRKTGGTGQNGKIYLLDKEDTASFKTMQQLMYAVQVL